MNEGQGEVQKDIPLTEAAAPVDLQMYCLPGDPPLEKKDIERYITSNKKLKDSLVTLIPRGLADPDELVRNAAITTISSAPESDQQHLRALLVPVIEKDLTDPNKSVRYDATKRIPLAPENERVTLMEKALADPDVTVRRSAATTISSAPEQKRTALLEKALADANGFVRESAATTISSAPKNDQKHLRASLVHLIKRDLADPDAYVRDAAIRMISSAPEEERTALLEKVFTHSDEIVSDAAIKTISSAPEEKRTALLEKALSNEVFRNTAIRMIFLAPENERAPLLEKALADPDEYNREIATTMISSAPEQERAALLEKALADPDEFVRNAAQELISSLSENETQQDIDHNPELLDRLKNLAETTPLYKDPGDKRSFQYGFNKTGSELLLLDIVPGSNDKSLREKVIKRTIPMDAYYAWQKAYESSDLWKSMGFDYVPVEPIVSVKESKEKNMQVDAYTRVLKGPSAHTWVSESRGLYAKHVKEHVEKIKTGLEKLGIDHGHLHNNNFVLVFDRDQENNPDLKKPPHVYAIDFDAARS